ncbi:peptidoglycan-binding protein [Streptomyces sp. NPDC088244]|uniref:peptidoglycan-binding domain-containing protein n=1 Tax=Streptomyces sp. NPDC088244 TaxID=3365841 RepID=UPI00381F2182
MVGSKVRQIQCLLNSNHDYTLTVDGKFGESTDVAVRAIQSCSGLKPDGQVGPQTWKYLDTPCPAAGIEASDPVPAVPPASGRHGFFAWCEGMVVLRAPGRGRCLGLLPLREHVLGGRLDPLAERGRSRRSGPPGRTTPYRRRRRSSDSPPYGVCLRKTATRQVSGAASVPAAGAVMVEPVGAGLHPQRRDRGGPTTDPTMSRAGTTA